VNDANAAQVASRALDEKLMQCTLGFELGHAMEIDLGFDAVQTASQAMRQSRRQAGTRKLDFPL
jgi:hypothetical protein